MHLCAMSESSRHAETLPVPPGTSPFHVKGLYYARILENAQELPGGRERLLDDLVDPRVRDFLRQRFHFSTWYDAFPMLPCAVTAARIRSRPLEEYLREAGRTTMRRLIPSMFRVLSRLGGPRLAAAHAPRLFQMNYDFVELRLSRVTDSDGAGTISGIPSYLAPVVVSQIAGIITGALESLGARDIESSQGEITVNGSKGGFDLVTCRTDFKWRLEGTPAHRR